MTDKEEWNEVDVPETENKEEDKVQYEVEGEEDEKVEASSPTKAEEKTTKGGILLPDSTREDISYLTTVGRVLKLGELAYQDPDKFPNGAWCKKNDYIAYGKHVGQKLFYKGVRLLLLFDDQVIMKVEDPTDLDPTFNLTKGSF